MLIEMHLSYAKHAHVYQSKIYIFDEFVRWWWWWWWCLWIISWLSVLYNTCTLIQRHKWLSISLFAFCIWTRPSQMICIEYTFAERVLFNHSLIGSLLSDTIRNDTKRPLQSVWDSFFLNKKKFLPPLSCHMAGAWHYSLFLAYLKTHKNGLVHMWTWLHIGIIQMICHFSCTPCIHAYIVYGIQIKLKRTFSLFVQLLDYVFDHVMHLFCALVARTVCGFQYFGRKTHLIDNCIETVCN